MQRLLNRIEQEISWKQCLRKSCRMNNVKTSLASTLTPLKIRPLYERLLKTYELNQQKARTCWFENQLRAYHWVLIVVSWIESIHIENFTQKQWQLLQEIFNLKQLHVLQYEAIRLNSKRVNSVRPWHKQQDQILKTVIGSKDSPNKWNDVARTLYESSNRKYYRSGKQCRERWLNHLDPNKKHGNWSKEEDFIIAQYILENGKKWSEIAKRMGNVRTEHMVKNRFKSIIIQYKKTYPQIQQNDILTKVIKDSNIKQNQMITQDRTYNLKDIEEDEQDQQDQQEEQEEKEEYQENYSNQDKFTIPNTAFKPESLTKSTRQIGSDGSMFSPGSPAVIGFSSFQNHQRQGQNQNQKSNVFQLKLFSPFCVTYTPQNSVTPLYVSPPPSIPFFMSNFAQSCLRFSSHLNEASIQDVQNTKDPSV